MKIAQINYIQNAFNINKSQKKNSSNIINDCFVKTTSFSGKKDECSFDEFKKWAEETDFCKNASKIISSSGNIIGSGFEGTVYSIPDTDKWVIKTYKRSNLVSYQVDKPEIIEVRDVAPNLNIGQMVASVRVPLNARITEQFYVLKKQKGNPLGVHHVLMNNVSAGSTKMHLNSLDALAKLPPSSYDKLIKDIAYVTDCGYQFDGETPNNYLLDEDSKTINFVDIGDPITDKKSQYAEVLYALLGANFNETFLNSHRTPEEKQLADKLSTTICAKFISAMSQNDVKFSNTLHFKNLINSKSFTNLLETSDIKEKVKLLAENNLY